jgi:multiple sugar transport system permease protein
LATSAIATKPKRTRLLRQEQLDAYLCLAPWAIGQVVFVIGPMLFSFALTFMDWSLLSPPQFVGLDNFQRLLEDELFYTALYNTAYYTFLAVPLHLLIALVVALAVNLPLRGINAIRTIYYMPSITPQVASIILWLWIFNPEWGLANAVLRLLGWGDPPLWFADPDWAKLTFVIISLWGFGEAMIIFLAGLQGIPETLYEAARIDGAGFVALFRHITLPMLTPVIFFNLVIGIIGSFQVFTAAFIATNREGGLGGPANSTLFLVLYLYKHGFSYFRMGYASLLAWVLFAIILAFTVLQFRMARRWVHYEGEAR